MESVFLKIHYGPYQAHGIIRHKLHRLHGLIELLNQQNYTFEVIPSPHLNRLSIDMMEREIFTCDIRYFLYNLPADNDLLCRKALEAIKKHQILFYNTENIPNFSDVKEGMRSMFKPESVDSDYNLLMPQNSLKSILLTTDWSYGELPDVYSKYRYGMYNLGSADSILDTQDYEGAGDKSNTMSNTTLSSGLPDINTICDDSTCYPTCPPGSVVQSELSSVEFAKSEWDKAVEEDEQKPIFKKVKKVEEVKKVTSEGEKMVSEYSEDEEGIYRCEKCDNCICD